MITTLKKYNKTIKQTKKENNRYRLYKKQKCICIFLTQGNEKMLQQ